jgi:hypothetical protein
MKNRMNQFPMNQTQAISLEAPVAADQHQAINPEGPVAAAWHQAISREVLAAEAAENRGA